jgi:hypothetical protein
MGQFQGYVTPTVEVPLTDKQSITFRGLDLNDLSTIISNNLDGVSKAVDLYSRSKADIFAQQNMQGFILVLAKDFPGVVTEVISVASDSPEVRDMKLPFPFQLRALAEISKLTLEEVGGMGNLFATLGALWKGARDAGVSRPLDQMSNGSIGESART